MKCRKCWGVGGPYCLCGLCEKCIAEGAKHASRCPDVVEAAALAQKANHEMGWLKLEAHKRSVTYAQTVFVVRTPNVEPVGARWQSTIVGFFVPFTASRLAVSLEAREHGPRVSFMRHAKSTGTWFMSNREDGQPWEWSPWFNIGPVPGAPRWIRHEEHVIAAGLEVSDGPVCFALALASSDGTPCSGECDVYVRVNRD